MSIKFIAQNTLNSLVDLINFAMLDDNSLLKLKVSEDFIKNQIINNPTLSNYSISENINKAKSGIMLNEIKTLENLNILPNDMLTKFGAKAILHPIVLNNIVASGVVKLEPKLHKQIQQNAYTYAKLNGIDYKNVLPIKYVLGLKNGIDNNNQVIINNIKAEHFEINSSQLLKTELKKEYNTYKQNIVDDKPLDINEKISNLTKTDTLDTIKSSISKLGDYVSDSFTKITKAVKSMLGLKYALGSKGAYKGKATDCSGFVKDVYKACGVSIPDGTYYQAKAGTVISKDFNVNELKVGDLIFIDTNAKNNKKIDHVVMYLGTNDKGEPLITHASQSRGTIIEVMPKSFIKNTVQVNRYGDFNDKNITLKLNANLTNKSNNKVTNKINANIDKKVVKKNNRENDGFTFNNTENKSQLNNDLDVKNFTQV